jgi:antitoxin YefM
MRTLTYSQSRAHYKETLDSVTDDREEVVTTRPGKEDVIMVSRSDYESLRETAYLLRSPANARRILGSIEELEAGRGAARDLSE